jgi:NADH-quinone oxidoreductase subunit N
MDITVLQHLAANNLWSAITPEIMLGGLALVLLVIELLFPKQQHQMVPVAALVGLVCVLGTVLFNFHSAHVGTETFNGLLRHSRDGQIMRVFFLLAALMVCLLARVSLAKQTMPRVEFYHIVLVVTAGMMLLAQSNNLLLLFVALETVTIGLYILVSYYRSNSLTLEAGLKYLVMGALSSSLLLFGIVLLYGVAGNAALPGHTSQAMHYGQLAAFLAANPHNFLASIGIVLVLSGVAFKIGAFPFQIWVPDVYQGAPTPVTAFLAVSSKAVGFAVLLSLSQTVFASYGWLLTPVLTFFAATTLLFGNLAALTQHNVKRLIGLSGVSHAGFLLLGVAAAATVPMAVGAVVAFVSFVAR